MGPETYLQAEDCTPDVIHRLIYPRTYLIKENAFAANEMAAIQERVSPMGKIDVRPMKVSKGR